MIVDRIGEVARPWGWACSGPGWVCPSLGGCIRVLGGRVLSLEAEVRGHVEVWVHV